MAYRLGYSGYSATPAPSSADDQYRLQYSDYPGTAEGPPDPARWIGPPGPAGPPGPQGIPGPVGGGYVLPVASASVLGGVMIDGATVRVVGSVLSAIGPVASVAGRIGAVTLAHTDITDWNATLAPYALTSSLTAYAPLASPVFTGDPRAPTPTAGDNDTSIATTAFVQAAVSAGTAGVASFNGRTGIVTLSAADVSAAGGPYLPTAGGALTGGINFGAVVGSANNDLTKHIALFSSNIGFGVTGSRLNYNVPAAASHYFRSSNADRVQITDGGLTMMAGTALTLAADPTAALQASTKQYTDAADGLKAPLASPTFTGTPAAPTVAATAAAGTTQLATTAFVRNGTTTNDNAIAGQVGEYISAVATLGSVNVLTGTATNITSISLTAGDWDARGIVSFVPAGTTTATIYLAGISTTSATMPGPGGGAMQQITVPNTAGSPNVYLAAGAGARLSLASTTTVYLVGQSNFSVSTMGAGGFIAARRVR